MRLKTFLGLTRMNSEFGMDRNKSDSVRNEFQTEIFTRDIKDVKTIYIS